MIHWLLALANEIILFPTRIKPQIFGPCAFMFNHSHSKKHLLVSQLGRTPAGSEMPRILYIDRIGSTKGIVRVDIE